MNILALNNPSKKESNLICFHWVGGSANGFKPLAKSLESMGVQTFGVSLPGRFPKSAHLIIKDIKTIVDQIFQLIISNRNKFNDFPLIFFGHSFGKFFALRFTNISFLDIILSNNYKVLLLRMN